MTDRPRLLLIGPSVGPLAATADVEPVSNDPAYNVQLATTNAGASIVGVSVTTTGRWA